MMYTADISKVSHGLMMGSDSLGPRNGPQASSMKQCFGGVRGAMLTDLSSGLAFLDRLLGDHEET